MTKKQRRKGIWSGTVDDYIPVATDMPRELHPGNTWDTTATLAAASGIGVGLVDGLEEGLVAAATTAAAHRVATSAAWDEYDQMRADAEEAIRKNTQQNH